MKARGCLAVLVCATALVLPASAVAKPGYYVSPHDHSVEAQVRGSNGYRLAISVFSGLFTVTASKATEKAAEQVLYYLFNGQLRNDRMRAHLPGVGGIDLHFHERSRSRENPAHNCKGPGALVRRGIFQGRFKLTGERAYTRVDVRAIHGEIVDEPRQVCRRTGRARASAGAQEELLRAEVPRGRGTLEFSAIEWGSYFGSLPDVFAARLIRQRGQMFVFNSIYGFTRNPEAIALDRPPLSGSVIPPKPFTGTATFQRQPGGIFTWLGDLTAELPGVGPVKLAGPDFSAEACLGRSCKGSTAPPKRKSRPSVDRRPTAAAPTPSPWRWPGSPR